jgi:hypothetical protein
MEDCVEKNYNATVILKEAYYFFFTDDKLHKYMRKFRGIAFGVLL